MNNSEARKRLQDQVNAANNPVFPPDNHGVCPRCRKHTFIGHGPLCSECYGMDKRSEVEASEIVFDAESLESACLEGLMLTEHGWRYRPSVGAAAVLAAGYISPARHDALIAEAKAAGAAEVVARVEAVLEEHWDWKAGRALHAAVRAALATGGEGRG